MKALKWVAVILVLVGGLNWGLVGFFGYDLVTSLFGAGALTDLVFDLVGVSAIWLAFSAKKMAA